MSDLGELERVVLAGFMGSGKSTVGRLLAAELGWRFADLDAAIEERAGMGVPAIFANLGEARFREWETACLGDLLREARTVIALGGGAPEIAANRELLESAARTRVVLLEAPFAVLMERCGAQGGAAARPLLADHDVAEARFARRAGFYREVAHEVVLTAELDAAATVREILERLREVRQTYPRG